MVRTFQYALRPSPRQVLLLESALAVCCELYNAALQERRGAWRSERKSIGLFDQIRSLTEIRAFREDVAELPVDMAREPLRRVDRAFQAFFRRVKGGQTPGYPRFHSRHRYDSLACSAPSFRIEKSTVVVSKLGGFRMRMHREIKGRLRHCTIRRSGKRWRVSIVCDIGSAPEKRAVSSAVGLDMGLETFATLSDGQRVEQPKWAKESEALIQRKNRELATKKRCSKNRAKASEQLRRVHEQVANRRKNFCHHVSKWLIQTYDLIAFEKLNIQAMTGGRLAKSIMSAAWGILLRQIIYKAEEAGGWAVPVNPRGTSQICSQCGAMVPKSLKDRLHLCPHCGLMLGRDHNAALNIVQAGRACVGLLPQEGPS